MASLESFDYGDASPSTHSHHEYEYGSSYNCNGKTDVNDNNNNSIVDNTNNRIDSNASFRPKRRCSITKFSLAADTPLNAAAVINDLRNNGWSSLSSNEQLPAVENDNDNNYNSPQDEKKRIVDDSVSTFLESSETSQSSIEQQGAVAVAVVAPAEKKKPGSDRKVALIARTNILTRLFGRSRAISSKPID